MEWIKDEYRISTDKSLLSLDAIYDFLSRKSYWAQERTQEQIQKTIENCLCYGVYDDGKQIGFARVLTDYVCLYYLFDVFIIEEYRGKSLGKWLVECIVNTPELKTLRGMLSTQDAHGLYEKYGFKLVANNDRLMYRPAAK